jgi:TonB-linked SusC/RagA family outer membrane protein
LNQIYLSINPILMSPNLLLKGRIFSMLLCLLFSSMVVSAQTRHTGRITASDDNLPIPGATIRVKGTAVGTQTDTNGQFGIEAAPGSVLVISFIGYRTQEVTVGTATTINVVLQSGSNTLNELVVTGYGVQRKKDLVGAVTVVDVVALARQPSASVENQLQGQAAGVTVVASGQPGQTPQVKIRGANTFGNNQPLYVVDGVPVSGAGDINPNDIASLQVLKDAGSASIYGARAANGVIIITTKKGSGKVSIAYDAFYGTQVPKGGNVFDLLNPTEMMSLRKLAIQNTATLKGITPNFSSNLYGPNGDVLPDYINPAGAKYGDPSADPSLYNVNPFYTSGDASGFYRISEANKQGTDWFHEIFNPAPIQSHNLNVSGSSDAATYLFSMNYFNQQGTLTNTYIKRYTIRANTSYNVTKKIRVGENLSYSLSENPQVNQNDEGSGIGMAFREQRIIPVYDIKGNFAGSNTANLGNARNPVAIQERIKNNYGLTNRLFGNVFAEADILPYVTLRTQFGGEYYSNYNHNFTFPEYENAENNGTNSYSENSFTGFNYTWTNTATYHQIVGKHDIKLLAGTEIYKNTIQNLGGTNTNYFTFDPNFVNLSTGNGTPTVYSNLNTDKIFSLLARLDYTFNDRFLLNATIRRDEASVLQNKKYGWFPAVSAGYRLSEESFIKNLGWINDLKIRGGYGIMGNIKNVNTLSGFTTYGSNRLNTYYDLGGSGSSTSPGFSQRTYGNPDAIWELDKNTNLGFDGTFFNNKLDISADYYVKKITGLLFNPPLAGTAGTATSPFSNVSEMQNHGFDLAITSHNKFSDDFNMNATLTFTTYSNKINKVTTGQNYFELNQGRFNGNYIIRNQVGGPVGGFFGYKTEGFWDNQAEIDAANAGAGGTYQSDAALGRFKYADMNGDGKITAADRTLLGNPNPKFTGGLNLDFTYKRFDLNMFLYGSYGNKIWNDVRWWTDFYANFGGAKSRTALYDSWTPSNLDAKAPIQEIDGSFSTNTVPNSYYVENGSYLRLRNVQLGYTFAPDLLKSIGVDRFRIYLSAANLFTVTNYSGVDPEITGSGNNADQNSSVNFGVDRGNYSPNRTYLLGVQVKF